jgi:hypothetical protein
VYSPRPEVQASKLPQAARGHGGYPPVELQPLNLRRTRTRTSGQPPSLDCHRGRCHHAGRHGSGRRWTRAHPPTRGARQPQYIVAL